MARWRGRWLQICSTLGSTGGAGAGIRRLRRLHGWYGFNTIHPTRWVAAPGQPFGVDCKAILPDR